MNKAEEVCSRLSPELQDQAIELCRIEEAMRNKIDSVLPEFAEMDLAQRATTQKDETVWKINPAMQEARALFRDYAAVVKSQKDLFENVPHSARVSSIDALKKKYKLA